MVTEQLTDEQVYQKHVDELIRFAMGLVGRTDAPDVVSEAVLRAWSTSGWGEVANKRAYLYRAVLNQAKNAHRDRQRRWARELKAAESGRTELPDCRPEVLEAVRRLSLRQRAVVYLAYWDDLPAGEIADCLGISSGSVHRHLARARAKLRVMLDD
jgi:RNA polymerase sigma-70 factor (ECF subfamily)